MRDADADAAEAGVMTTGVVLGKRRTLMLARALMIICTLYAGLILSPIGGVLSAVALLVPFTPNRIELYWTRVKLWYGVEWLTICAYIFLMRHSAGSFDDRRVSDVPLELAPPGHERPLEAKLFRLINARRLGVWLALVAICLSAPCLFIGFYLDDYIGRYVWSDLPGAHALNRLIEGGYTLANGNPADNLWQVEQGYAPGWIYDHLLVRLYRPISLATHLLDAKLWLHSAFMMHAHSLLWLGVLVIAATRMYRAALGRSVGGFAALLFSVDHTHVSHAAIIAAPVSWRTQHGVPGVLHRFARTTTSGRDRRAHRLRARPSGDEASLAVAGYLLAYALFAEKGPIIRRALAFAPYLLVTVAWRGLYNFTGHGARGSGLYLDPGRDPVHFVVAMLERGPVLLLGQFFIPPAEAYSLGGGLFGPGMLGFAIVFSIALVLAFVPLLVRSRTARFWAMGMLISLVPSSTWPHNRQLLFTSFRSDGSWWRSYGRMFVKLRGQAPSVASQSIGAIGAVLLLGRLVISPWRRRSPPPA
jgi:hypothetical protein